MYPRAQVYITSNRQVDIREIVFSQVEGGQKPILNTATKNNHLILMERKQREVSSLGRVFKLTSLFPSNALEIHSPASETKYHWNMGTGWIVELNFRDAGLLGKWEAGVSVW